MGQKKKTSAVRKKLGMRIRTLRVQQHMTQKLFGLMTGMDRTYLSAVERGRRNVSLDNLEKIANGLGVTLAELFEGVDEPRPKELPESDYYLMMLP